MAEAAAEEAARQQDSGPRLSQLAYQRFSQLPDERLAAVRGQILEAAQCPVCYHPVYCTDALPVAEQRHEQALTAFKARHPQYYPPDQQLPDERHHPDEPAAPRPAVAMHCCGQVLCRKCWDTIFGSSRGRTCPMCRESTVRSRLLWQL